MLSSQICKVDINQFVSNLKSQGTVNTNMRNATAQTVAINARNSCGEQQACNDLHLLFG